MLSPGRQELAADTRSASTLFQSKSCLRAGRSILVELFRCSFQHIYLYIGRSNDHLVYVSHQECVAQVRSSLSDCLVGFVQHVRLQHLLQKNILIKQNEGHVSPASMSSIPLTCSDHQIQAPSQAPSE